MAKQKRMFSSVITKQDEFLDMPLSAQALYFHLNLEADDEGFVSNVKSLMRQVRCNEDDFKILLAKRYLLSFESSVIVVKHWFIHNTIRQDRVIETTYKEEREKLDVKENGSYTEKVIEQKNLNVVKDDELGGVRHLPDKCPPNLTILSYTKLIIDYLNLKIKTRYRYNNTKTQSHINARFNEGFTVEDFYKVIDNKYEEWKDTERAIYLRPETLFGTKFESYLNQKEVVTKDDMWNEVRNL